MPVPVGGAGRLAEAMTAAAVEAGCTIVTDASVARIVIHGNKAVGVETTDGRAFSAKRAVVADTHAHRLFHDLVGDDNLPASFLDALRWFRPGSGMFRMDLALDGDAPWSDEGLSEAGVIHVVGTTEDMDAPRPRRRRGSCRRRRCSSSVSSRLPTPHGHRPEAKRCGSKPMCRRDRVMGRGLKYVTHSPTTCSTGSRSSRRSCARASSASR